MNDGYVTIQEIEKETGIPGSTVRRYLEQHNHTLRTKKNNRGAWLLKVEDLSLMREIRSCYERKMSSSEVEEYLLNSGQPLTVTIDDEEDEHSITPANAFMMVAAEVKKLQNELSSTTMQLAGAHEKISELQEQNEENARQQQKTIAALTEELKSVSEGIKRMEEEQKKKGEQSFWSRIFGKKENS